MTKKKFNYNKVFADLCVNYAGPGQNETFTALVLLQVICDVKNPLQKIVNNTLDKTDVVSIADIDNEMKPIKTIINNSSIWNSPYIIPFDRKTLANLIRLGLITTYSVDQTLNAKHATNAIIMSPYNYL